jgi:hypothetical protein
MEASVHVRWCPRVLIEFHFELWSGDQSPSGDTEVASRGGGPQRILRLMKKSIPKDTTRPGITTPWTSS